MCRCDLPIATRPADKINSGLLVLRLVRLLLAVTTFRSIARSVQPLSAKASICRRDNEGVFASDFLWQYTATAFAQMADVTGMLIKPTMDSPTLAALRQLFVTSYRDLE